MDHKIYFSVEESTVFTSHVNKEKLAGVRIEGPDKFYFVRDFAKLL